MRILIIATYSNVIETLEQIAAFVPLENLRQFSSSRMPGIKFFDMVDGEERPIKGSAVNELRIVGIGTQQVRLEAFERFVRDL
ncbi:MAG: hypothetical protein OSB69_13625 [Alphaproteobacteria bacterium]|nr:hypothetical protein [Alphaproteobacteria bacterium]